MRKVLDAERDMVSVSARSLIKRESEKEGQGKRLTKGILAVTKTEEERKKNTKKKTKTFPQIVGHGRR